MPTSAFAPMTLKQSKAQLVPGPGTYDGEKLKFKESRPAYTMRKFLNPGSPYASRGTELWPSPAEYQIDSDNVARTIKPMSPKYSLTSPLEPSESKTRERPYNTLTTQERLLERCTNGVPGPGTYLDGDQLNTVGAGLPGSPMYSMRLRPKANDGVAWSPGPIYFPSGDHQIGYEKKQGVQPGKSISRRDLKIMVRGHIEPGHAYTPGPGSYGSTQIANELKFQRPPQFSFGEGSFDEKDIGRSPRLNRNSPGPGAYQANPNWGFPDSPNFVFTKRPDTQWTAGTETPASQLNMTQFPSYKQFHIQGLNDYALRTHKNYPGPGAYDWDKNIDEQKPRSPTFHMGMKRMDFSQVDHRDPGISQDAYLALKPHSPLCVIQGKPKAKPRLPEPGPGHYQPRVDQFTSHKDYNLH